MKAEDIQTVWDHLQTYPGRHRVDLWKEGAVLPIFAETSTQFDQIRRERLETVVALGLLGPRYRSPPPELCEAFESILCSTDLPETGNRTAQVMDLAIAYGCGWGRNTNRTSEDWDGRWDNAWVYLAKWKIQPVLQRARGWLRGVVRDFPKTGKEEFETICESEVLSLNARFQGDEERKYRLTGFDSALRITCTEEHVHLFFRGYMEHEGIWEEDEWEQVILPGSRYLLRIEAGQGQLSGLGHELDAGFTLTIQADDERARIGRRAPGKRPQWNWISAGDQTELRSEATLTFTEPGCSCGTRACGNRHRLESWKPQDQSLADFISSAVGYFQEGDFVDGLYFDLLSTEGIEEGGHLRQVPVEYRTCQAPTDQPARCGKHYEGTRCRDYHPFDERRDRRVPLNRLVLTGTDIPIYDRVERFRCRECGNLFVGRRCPIEACAWTLPDGKRRAVTVWVCTFMTGMDLDDPEEGEAIQFSEWDRDPQGDWSRKKIWWDEEDE